ncbi:hypothetical protein NM688_g5570 [Phlebia brevispora]|uniref:Uncharacterized protein n=1 Tax=Phlebia brevispora TaxID=194682 RepID=A0ACC1STD9_9APHY|nr:hypothetical protein NM688_g5570 [Phlebia brevispora]
MLSIKSLAILILAFEILSSLAVPRLSIRAEDVAKSLTNLNSALQEPVGQLRSLSANNASVATLTPIIDNLNLAINVAINDIDSAYQKPYSSSSGADVSVDVSLSEVGKLLGDVLKLVFDVLRYVLHIVDGLLGEDVDPLLTSVGDTVTRLVSSVLNITGGDVSSILNLVDVDLGSLLRVVGRLAGSLLDILNLHVNIS